MVVLHVKSAAPAASPSSPDTEEETEFLYKCAASAAVADVAFALAGLQARLLSLCRRLRLRERGADAGAAAAGELERALDEAEAYASILQGSKRERIQLCWAGKELAMDHKLCDYIGVNDFNKDCHQAKGSSS